jgi:hypothetical protein
MFHWKMEFHRVVPEWNIFVFHGRKKEQLTARFRLIKTDTYTVYITTPEMIASKDMSPFFQQVDWKMMVTDLRVETSSKGDSVRKELMTVAKYILLCQQLANQIPFKLAVTYRDLEKNPTELMEILHFLYPFLFTAVPTNIDLIDQIPQAFSSIFYKRRTMTEMSYLLSSSNHEFVLPCSPTTLQMELTKHFLLEERGLLEKLEKIRQFSYKYGDVYDETLRQLPKSDRDQYHFTGKERTAMNNLMTKLKKTSNSPLLFCEMSADENDEVMNVDSPGNSNNNGVDLINSSGKFIVLDKLLEKLLFANCTNGSSSSSSSTSTGSSSSSPSNSTVHKILLLCQEVTTLELLSDYVDLKKESYHLNYFKMDHNTTDGVMKDVISRLFNESGSKIHLIAATFKNFKSNDVSYWNYSAADTVIFFDSEVGSNSDIKREENAFHSVYRLEQTHTEVSIYRLLMENTPESIFFSNRKSDTSQENEEEDVEGSVLASDPGGDGLETELSQTSSKSFPVGFKGSVLNPINKSMDSVISCGTVLVQIWNAVFGSSPLISSTPNSFCSLFPNNNELLLREESRLKHSNLLNAFLKTHFTRMISNNFSSGPTSLRRPQPFIRQGHCQICWHGGQLICCDACPLAFHFTCMNIGKFYHNRAWSCPQHECVYCDRKRDVIKCLFRCEGCKRAYCEECLPKDCILKGENQYFVSLGFILPSATCYIRCGGKCNNFDIDHYLENYSKAPKLPEEMANKLEDPKLRRTEPSLEIFLGSSAVDSDIVTSISKNKNLPKNGENDLLSFIANCELRDLLFRLCRDDSEINYRFVNILEIPGFIDRFESENISGWSKSVLLFLMDHVIETNKRHSSDKHWRKSGGILLPRLNKKTYDQCDDIVRAKSYMPIFASYGGLGRKHPHSLKLRLFFLLFNILKAEQAEIIEEICQILGIMLLEYRLPSKEPNFK